MSENFEHSDDAILPEQILEAIEACRAGSNDASEGPLARVVNHPDFAEIRGRIASIDTQIKKAFGEVVVPVDLHVRILAALADADDAAGDNTIDPSTPKPMPLGAVVGARLRQRSWYATHWYLAASAIFVSASILLALFIQWNTPPQLSEALIVQTAMDTFDTHGSGQPLGKTWPAAARKFRPSNDLAMSNCTSVRWQPLDDFLGTSGALYTFIAPGGARSELYVLKSPGKIKGLSSTPPWSPQRNTGGRRASAWQVDGRLYVLVVNGNTKAYRRLLSPAGPLT